MASYNVSKLDWVDYINLVIMLIPWLSRLPSFNFYSFYHTNIFVKSPCRLATWWSTEWPYQKVVTDQIFKKNLNVSIYLQSGLNVGEQALTCVGSVRYCKASQVAQWAKNPLEMLEIQETWAWSLGWEDPLEEGMAACSSILAWRIPRTEEPKELQSTGLQKVRHNWSDWAHRHTHTHTHTHTCYLPDSYSLLFPKWSLTFCSGASASRVIRWLTIYLIQSWYYSFVQCLVLGVHCEVFLTIEIFVPQKENRILAKITCSYLGTIKGDTFIHWECQNWKMERVWNLNPYNTYLTPVLLAFLSSW